MGWRHDINYIAAFSFEDVDLREAMATVLNTVPIDATCKVEAFPFRYMRTGSEDFEQRFVARGGVVKIRFARTFAEQYESATYDAVIALARQLGNSAALYKIEASNTFGIEAWQPVEIEQENQNV